MSTQTIKKMESFCKLLLGTVVYRHSHSNCCAADSFLTECVGASSYGAAAYSVAIKH
jgi:hypothetical protein